MKLAIVDDEKGVRFALEELFSGGDFEISAFESAEMFIKNLKNNYYDIAIIDYQLPGMTGIGLLKEIKSVCRDTEVIIMTGFGSDKLSVEALKNGAYDFIIKPFNNEELLNRVSHCRDKIVNRLKNVNSFGYYFSDAAKEIIETVKTAAVIDSPILITGESGTGKELLAKQVHYYSGRSGRFIAVNCSAIPESLIESEFFGSEKGAFTGSTGLKKGLFELSDRGTIFLDEIGEMPVELQVKILRVLQENEITRVGGGIPIKIDARIIAATNRNIELEVSEKRFREDLYYRLNVVRIKTKSLTERRDEIKALSEVFLREYCLKHNKKIAGFSAELINDMINYSWPGNIRELKNKIENAVIFCKDELISSLAIESSAAGKNTVSLGGKYDFEKLPDNITQAKRFIVEEFEFEFIKYHLGKNYGNVRSTAVSIGLSRQDLYKKLNFYGIGYKNG